MLILPVKYRKRHSHKARAEVDSPPAGDLAVTSVIDVSYNPDTQELTLTAVFNTTAAYPLVGVADADSIKWNARYNNINFNGEALTQLSANQVRIKFYQLGNQTAPNLLEYMNDPSDISDASGRQLAAFDMGF